MYPEIRDSVSVTKWMNRRKKGRKENREGEQTDSGPLEIWKNWERMWSIRNVGL